MKKLTNIEVIGLINAGLLQTTNHEVSPVHAYKIVKFRKALKSAYEEIGEMQKALMTDAGIEEGKLEEASKNNTDAWQKYVKMNAEMLKEESKLDGIKALPYDEWWKWQNENKAVKMEGRDKEGKPFTYAVDILSSMFVENTLEGILWNEPEEATKEAELLTK